ncbi:hypothetical protein OK016_00055 [Vibrio chagasii]|nr:hypothetical protein [Vibrio chagasii]
MTTVSLRQRMRQSPKARTSPTRRHWTKSCGWRGDGDATMVQRSLSLMA